MIEPRAYCYKCWFCFYEGQQNDPKIEALHDSICARIDEKDL